MDRREAIKNLARGLILTLIGTFTWLGYKNDKIVVASDCKWNNRCNECNQFNRCSLPKTSKQPSNGRR